LSPCAFGRPPNGRKGRFEQHLGEDPRQRKAHRALVATFLSGAHTQEAAAERLGLPFSTYRRHLIRGLEVLCSLLWRRELLSVELT